MTATLRYFRPLDAPRSCFLWEAIMWVAFGRFPESGEDIRDIYFDSDDEAEVGTVTFNWREHIFQQEYRFGGFSQSEIEAAGLNENSVDWAYYERALALTGYVRLELLTEEIARHRSLPERNENQDLALGWKRSPFAGEFETIPKERADRELKILEAHRDAVTPYIDSVHAGFQHHIDNAWAKIFNL